MKSMIMIIATIIILFTNASIFSQMTIWHDTTFIVLDEEDYNEQIKKSQIKWNNTYYALGIEGNVISDELLRTYLFSYMGASGSDYEMKNSEITDIYEEFQDFANGYIDDKTLHCYFYDDNFCYIVFFRIILKKDKKIIVKQDASYIPIKQDYQ